MYLETLHKSIKYCYLEGKQCKRLYLSINALMLLVSDESFERTIKITKQKRSTKLLEIIESHYKSKTNLPEMRAKFDNYWLLNSEKDINIKILTLNIKWKRLTHHVVLNVFYVVICVVTNPIIYILYYCDRFA